MTKKEHNYKYKSENKEKIKKYNTKYRRNNKNKIREIRKKYHQENKEKIKIGRFGCVMKRRIRASEYKLSIGCQICGYKKCPDALDFHHTLEENKIIAVNRLRDGNWDRFLLEAKKCIVVCRNCHAEIHFNKRNSPERKE